MDINQQLRARLATWREGCREFVALEQLLAGCCLVLAWVVAFVLMDTAWQVSAVACWLGWLLLLALGSTGAALLLRAWRIRACDASVAALAERAIPGCRNRLINAVQLGSTDHAGALIAERLLAELPPGWQRTPCSRLVNTAALRRLAWLNGGLVSAIVLMFVLNAPATSRALVRLFLPMLGEKPYTLTQLVMVRPGNTAVKRGSNLEVLAQTWGAVPEHVTLQVSVPGSPPLTVELESVPGETEGDRAGVWWRGRATDMFRDARYRVVAGDAESAWFEVAVLSLPGLLDWSARVTPPAYTGLKPLTIDKATPIKSVPVGSSVRIEGTASTPLRSARVTWGESQTPPPLEQVNGPRFATTFTMPEGGALKLRLSAGNDLDSTTPLPLLALPDAPPAIALADTPLRQTVPEEATVAIAFQASDDYGVRLAGLEEMPPDGKAIERLTAKPDTVGKTFRGRFLLGVKDLGMRAGQTRRCRLYAEDNYPQPTAKRRAYSAVFEITVIESEEKARKREEMAAQSKDLLLELVQLQRDNLGATRKQAETAAAGKAIAPAPLLLVIQNQRVIREKTVNLLKLQEALGDLANLLAALADNEMPAAVTALERAQQSADRDQAKTLGEAVDLETRILTALAGTPDAVGRETRYQEKADVLTMLRNLVAGQRQNLKDSETAQRDNAAADRGRDLAKTEDNLAMTLTVFRNQSAAILEHPGDEKFALQLRQASDLLLNEKTYEKMIAAAEALEGAKYAPGIQTQQEALAALLKALDILNKWTAEAAREKAKDAAELMKELDTKLTEMEAKQAKIAEVTRDLAKRGEMTDEIRRKLAEMDKEQEPMADLLEKLAQDLYQFPDLPVCNELNGKMREIFEDVQQALNSDKAPAVEVAVQKEDSLLDAIRNTKKRVEDVEMWLPDIPDNIVWNMESFDTDEFPNMPLVPLPDELEDIVGDLLEQAKDIEAKSQDTTGNNMMADAEMGWGIMDGPMPNFSAKGKSGNTKPNDNEMTGRSGAGREGQSNGEIVENQVKGLEGTATHARRTKDPLQKGQVTESPDSTMKARATGGGKLGGESETIGMFGDAPRRDTHMGEHGSSATQLRQETEALYTSARLLYLGGKGLGAAAEELRGLEENRNIKSMGSVSRRVMRRLEDVKTELTTGAAIALPVTENATRGGAAASDVDLDQITDENYRELVREYYRGLSGSN